MKKYNKDFKSVYFAQGGEMGLNLTSAAHLCALASQVIAEEEALIKGASFVTKKLQLISSKEEVVASRGFDKEQFLKLVPALNRISEMNGFIAWFSEGRKELENYKNARTHMSVYDFCDEVGIQYPERPESDIAEQVPPIALEDIVNEMSIADKVTYLSLEAEAAAIGKFIHPDKPFEYARAEMHRYVNNPRKASVNGRDTIIEAYEASVSPSLVDSTYVELQAKYRRVQQQLNHMKADLQDKLSKRVISDNARRQELADELSVKEQQYHAKLREINISYGNFIKGEEDRISKIKLAVPEKFKKTVEWLNHLAD